MIAFSPFDDSKVDRYMYGGCYLLARSINDLTGWEVVGITDYREEGHDPGSLRMEHALVRLPNGMLLDGSGIHTEEEIDQANALRTETHNRSQMKISARNAASPSCPEWLKSPPIISCGLMIHPTTPERLDFFIERRIESDRERFRLDCHQVAADDAVILVEWVNSLMVISKP